MSGILLPQIVIYNSLEAILRLLREDLREHPDDDRKTILYSILGLGEDGQPIQMNLYNYYKQAKKMLLTEGNLTVNFGYNQETAHMISLHIILPSEQADNACIGEDEGYIEDDVMDGDTKVAVQPTFTQMYNTTYQVMITSNNSSEVDVVYAILKSMLLMVVPHLELMGLRLPTLSGNDIMMQDDLAPVPIFHKVLNLSFKYELTVPQLVVHEVARRFHFIMRPIDYNDEK